MHALHSKNVVTTKEVVGVGVLAPSKEHIGEISDIVLDKISGKVSYFTLRTNGVFLGLGGKTHALPWNSIHYHPTLRKFMLSFDPDLLAKKRGVGDRLPNTPTFVPSAKAIHDSHAAFVSPAGTHRRKASKSPATHKSTSTHKNTSAHKSAHKKVTSKKATSKTTGRSTAGKISKTRKKTTSKTSVTRHRGKK